MAKQMPIGFTATEVESIVVVETCSGLQAHLEACASDCDDFLDATYAVELIAETLTDGSIKRSVRIRLAESI